MKHFVKHLLFQLLGPLLAGGVLAQGPIACNQWSFVHDVGPTAMTRFIAGNPTMRIGLCGYTLVASAASGGFQLAYGTGTNCGTGQTPLSPVINLPTGGVLVNRVLDIVERTPPGVDLCASSTGAGSTLDAIVYWTYF